MPDAPLFSVIIPSRDGKERLRLTLDSIARTDVDPGRIEVVVVDDGSSDGTYEEFSGRKYPFALQLHRVEFASQSATTNEAIRRSRGTYVLSSAQDILFDRAMFSEHLAWHERFAGEDVCVLGYLPYAPNVEVTPFMFYLVNGGFQFAYFLIRDRLRVPPNFLYAPNFSIRRELLERVGGFDEQFPFGSQDTDLGIRLQRAGVRMVYNRDAIGYHNHPVELDGFIRRQRMTGRSLARLERKHPDLEGGSTVWDIVLSRYLAVSSAARDALRRRVEGLEARLAKQRSSYQELWTRAFVHRERLEGFSDPERTTLELVQELFRGYQRLLQHPWGQGYLEESLEIHGRERVGEIVDARLLRAQSSVQMRRAIERNLTRHRIERTLVCGRDYERSLVVHGLDGYAAALDWLGPYLDADSMRYNLQILLVLPAGACSADQLAALEQCVEVCEAPAVDAGVLAALARCGGELATVRSAAVRNGDRRGPAIAQRMLARCPQIALLGGGLPGEGRGGTVCGMTLDGSPVVAGPTHEPLPIEATIPDLCVVRTAALPGLLERARSGGPWNLALGRAARESGLACFHLPALTCGRVSAGTAAPASGI